MTRILWVSRHNMSRQQLDDLKRIYGQNLQLTQYDATIRDVSVLEPYILASDVIAIVLPLEKAADLLRIAGGRPVIQAVSARVKMSYDADSSPADAGKTVSEISPVSREKNPEQNAETEYTFIHRYWQQIEELQIRVKRL